MRKGKWAVGFSDQGLGHGTYGVMVKDTSEVVIKDLTKDKAEEIVRRWNGFEDGGLVEELEGTLEKIADQAFRASLVQDRSVGIIKQTCKVIFSEAKAALAKS